MDHFKYEYLNKVGTMDKLEYDSKVNYSRSFAKSYGKMMTVLFLIIIAKRMFQEPHVEFSRIIFYLKVIGIFAAIIFFQDYNNVATRLSPFLVVILSFYWYSNFLYLQHENYTEEFLDSS
jgi:hypothetical protein